jgi:hypothetical protein
VYSEPGRSDLKTQDARQIRTTFGDTKLNKTLNGRLQTRRLQALLAAGALAAGLCIATSANATLVYNSNIGGAATGSIRENFNGLTLGSTTQTTSTGVTVSFSPNGQVVNGSINGQYAAPTLSGNNGVGFGSPDQNNGKDTTNYITAGGIAPTNKTTASNATLSWTSMQQYFGILWGSVDTYNTLTFYSVSAQNVWTKVGSVTGTNVKDHANGNQGPDGTVYVNFDSTQPFNKVVMTSTSSAFEFDNVAFSSHQLDLPEPGTLGMMGLGLLAIVGLAIRRRKLAVE